MDVIDTFLEVFIRYIDTGFGLLAGDVAYLSGTLIAIDITLAGLFWALGQNTDVIGALIRKVLYVGFFAFLIGNFSVLAGVVFDSFARLGVTAGAGTMAADDLLRPGFIAGVGLEAGQPLLDEIADMLGPIAFFHNFIMIVVMFVAWAVIILAFFVLAVQLFVTILEFKLTTLAGFVLVPFALWNKTTFLAERVLGHVITSGIKLMVLAVIIGIGSTLFASVTGAFRTGEDVTLAQVMGTVLAAVVFFWMGVFSPGLASGLITGAPQLGAGSAAGATAGIAAGTYAAGAGGRAALGAAAGGVSGAVQAGASLAGGARTAYALGAIASGARGAERVSAGLGGVAQAGTEAMGRAVSRPAQGMIAAYERGAQAVGRPGQTAGGTQRHGSTHAPSTGAASATGGGPDGASQAGAGPAWAQRLQAGQRLAQAGQIAVHAIRDGDRGASGANPSLADKED